MTQPRQDLQQSESSASPPRTERFSSYAEYINFIDDENGCEYFKHLVGYQDTTIPSDNFKRPDRGVFLCRYDFNGARVFNFALPYLSESYDESKAEYQHQQSVLAAFDEKVEHQIIFVSGGIGNVTDEGFWGFPFARWVVEVLGLSLDMEPSVWSYLHHTNPESLLSEGRYSKRRSTMWINNPNFIEIGKDAALVLHAIPHIRPTTAIFFLKMTDPELFYLSVHPSISPPATPLKAKQTHFPKLVSLPNSKIRSLVGWVESQTDELVDLGQGGIIWGYLEALLHCQITVPPRGIPEYGSTDLELKAWTQPVKDKFYYGNGTNVDPREIWITLRGAIDKRRATLLRLPEFTSATFTTTENLFRHRIEKLQARYQIYIQNLELEEARLKEYINIIFSSKSMEMAELSIRESRRVMLLTSLAFIFLPLSLSTSIFGMNIKQINATGHDIRVFVVASAGLVISTCILWTCVVYLMKYRKNRIDLLTGQAEIRRRIDSRVNRGVIDIVLMAKPTCPYRLGGPWWWPLWKIPNRLWRYPGRRRDPELDAARKEKEFDEILKSPLHRGGKAL